MRAADLLGFATGALRGHRLRASLSVAGVAVGIAAVVALTALGEGARRYVMQEFTALGSNLIVVLPGKVETTGAAPFGGVIHDLTLDDFRAISRLPRVRSAAPIVVANETVRYGDRGRSVPILGSTREFLTVRHMTVTSGSFLPPGPIEQGGNEIVIGPTLVTELFAGESPLGKVVRVGQWRFRVVGVLQSRARSIGFDLDNAVFIPVATAMRVFNRTSLFRVVIEARVHEEMHLTKRDITTLIAARHRADDITVITQDAMIEAFSAIMRALTLALVGIASVSLLVAGVGIMNVMLVSVTERRAEIGLLKAIGAANSQVLAVFLAEAALLSSIGGVVGLALGAAAVRVLVGIYPAFPAVAPTWAVIAALSLSLGVGMVFGVWPARRATRLDPVTALARR